MSEHLKKRIINCLNEAHFLTVEQLWRRFTNVRGYKVSYAVEELQIDGVLINLTYPGYPIGWKDLCKQRNEERY